MDCTKCIYDVACDLNRRMSGNNNPLKYDKECPIFKDKSLYIELPCKVRTKLYFLYNSPYADKPDLTPKIYETTDWYFEVDKTGIVINTSDIHSFNKKYDYYLGESVFLTREEAEKALAEREANGGNN